MKEKININTSVEDIHKIAQSTLEHYLLHSKYKNVLDLMANLHTYTTRNLLLILSQAENVTMLNSKGVWEYKQRKVKEGEEGIKIVKPVFEEDENGKQKIKSYSLSILFDISQTEGEPVKTNEYDETFVNENQSLIEEALLKSTDNFTITFSEKMEGEENSFVDFFNKKIAIRAGLSPKGNLKEIVKQVSNIVISNQNNNEKGSKLENIKEIESNSVAYIVGKRLGLNVLDIELPYLCDLSKEEVKDFKYNLNNIRSTSFKLLARISDQVVNQNKEKAKDEVEQE